MKSRFGVCLLAIGFALCGCVEQRAHVGLDCPTLRECPTNDCPYAEMQWREFRPFRVRVPTGIDVKCCCADEGRLEISVPGTELCATVRVDSSDDAIGEVKRFRYFADNLPRWCMEKQFSDRRLLMDLSSTGTSEQMLRCYCELNSDVCLLFVVCMSHDLTDSECASIWRLCRNIEFERKCFDAFNCLKTGRSYVSDGSMPANRKWIDPVSDIGLFAWKSFGRYTVFVPSDLEVERCGIDDDHFVFDLPRRRHYVTVVDYGEDSEVLDDRAGILRISGSRQDNLSAEEGIKRQCANTLCQWLGVDWFVDERFSDRRLLIEHRSQSEECEGVACYCDFDGGPVMELEIRGSGAISGDELDWFLQLCKKIKVEMRTE